MALSSHQPAVGHSSPKVLVTGAAGYIGSALLPILLRNGYQVRGLDVLLYGDDSIASLRGHPGFELIHGDMRRDAFVQAALEGVDTVIHLGAIVGDAACALDPDVAAEVNRSAAGNIARLARSVGVARFIHASTCSVYGANVNLVSETSSTDPFSIYAASKLASEDEVLSVATDEFSPTVLRIGTVYGVSGRIRFDLVINLLAASAIVDRQFTIIGGQQWRPFVHVADVALAIITTMEAPVPLVHRQIFNVGSDEQNMTLQEVGTEIQRLIPESTMISGQLAGDARDYRVDFMKIREVLRFFPSQTIENGITQVISLIQNGGTSDFRASRYSNEKALREGNQPLRDRLRLTARISPLGSPGSDA